MSSQTTADHSQLVHALESIINNPLDDLYTDSMEITQNYPEINSELIEQRRRLDLAISRELMDDHQTKLAYRVTIKNLVKRLRKSSEENS